MSMTSEIGITRSSRAAQLKRRIKRIVLAPIVGVLTASTLGFVGSAAPASVASVPLESASSTAFDCYTDHAVRVSNPAMTSSSSSSEYVWFTSALFRYNGSAWVAYGVQPGVSSQYPLIPSPPRTLGLTWFTGVASPSGNLRWTPYYGYWATWVYPNTTALPQVVYSNLPSGYYEVSEWYEWKDGTIKSLNLPAAAGGSYCHI